VRTHLTHLVWVRRTPLLSRLKSTSQSVTCTQVSQSIDNDLVDLSRLVSRWYAKSVDHTLSD